MQWAPFAFLNNPSEATSVWTEVGDFRTGAVRGDDPGAHLSEPEVAGTASNKVQIETWWEFRDDFSFTTNKGGSHNWKMGVASVRAPNTEDLTGNPLGTWTFSTDQLFNPNDPATIGALTKPTQFSASGPPVVHDLKTNLFQTYLQDAWRLSGGLTVNLGVRYDLDTAPSTRTWTCRRSQSRCRTSTRAPEATTTTSSLDWVSPGISTKAGNRSCGPQRTLQRRRAQQQLRHRTGQPASKQHHHPKSGVSGSLWGKDPLTFASTAPPNITIINDDIVNAFAQTANIGFSQQLARDLAIQVDGVYTRGSANLVSSNINSPDPTTGLRALPEWGRIVQVSPIGDTKYRALFVRVDKPFVNRLQYTVALTLVKGDDNLTSINYFNRAADWGPSNTDRRQTLVVSGSVMVPWSLMVGGVWTLRSAMPFSAVAATDLNNDGSITDLVPARPGTPATGISTSWRSMLTAPRTAARQLPSIRSTATATTVWTSGRPGPSTCRAARKSTSSLRSSTCSALRTCWPLGALAAMSATRSRTRLAGSCRPETGNRRSLLCASHGNGDGAGVIDHWMSSAKGVVTCSRLLLAG